MCLVYSFNRMLIKPKTENLGLVGWICIGSYRMPIANSLIPRKNSSFAHKESKVNRPVSTQPELMKQ